MKPWQVHKCKQEQITACQTKSNDRVELSSPPNQPMRGKKLFGLDPIKVEKMKSSQTSTMLNIICIFNNSRWPSANKKGGFISPIYTPLDTHTLKTEHYPAWSKHIGDLQKFLSQWHSSTNLQANVNFHCSKDPPLCAHWQTVYHQPGFWLRENTPKPSVKCYLPPRPDYLNFFNSKRPFFLKQPWMSIQPLSTIR